MRRAQRKDVVRNNRAIMHAAGEIMRATPDGVTIPAVAERAGLSVPTVYRYYASSEDLLGSYRTEVIAQMRDYSHNCGTTGAALFDDVLREWGSVIEVYGPGMVQLRSQRGFLERLHSGDETMVLVRSAWERPLRLLLKSHSIDADYFESALFLFNIMFDPREILDLTRRGLSMSETLEVLKGGYIAALRGWADSEALAI